MSKIKRVRVKNKVQYLEKREEEESLTLSRTLCEPIAKKEDPV